MNRILSGIKGTNIKEAGISIFDIFIIVNIMLFVLMCIFVYYDRFVVYRGSEHVLEFYVYAMFIFFYITIIWICFRKYSWSLWEVFLIEIMILIHFAGGFVHIDQKRLYDNVFFSIRFDKYAHFINSFIGAILVARVLHYLDFKMKMLQGLVIILIVLGVGAFIEISEYIVMMTVPGNGVGGYDNNMQDLMANLAGSTVFIMLKSLKR
jgi:hypothetical protein